GMKLPSYKRAWLNSGKTILTASVALIFTVPMVQVFINSGTEPKAEDNAVAEADHQEDDEDQPRITESMPKVLADGVASSVGWMWPFFSPLIGGFGAFVAGSNTVSNMMFSLFQFDVGNRLGLEDPTWIVALQAVGGAAGNTICVHNVVAASAVVGMTGREGSVIRKTLPLFLGYALLSGSLGYAIVTAPTVGVFNAGTVVFTLFLLSLIGWGIWQSRSSTNGDSPALPIDN
ncbi:MAG: L-lactate permease, partial [Planctomycetaceae bacterium]|nr:L-lactate permease [Planctomycetaceae bacterium]